MDIWKTMCGTLWHSLAPDIPAAGHFEGVPDLLVRVRCRVRARV